MDIILNKLYCQADQNKQTRQEPVVRRYNHRQQVSKMQ